jgi:hypothetical protein
MLAQSEGIMLELLVQQIQAEAVEVQRKQVRGLLFMAAQADQA